MSEHWMGIYIEVPLDDGLAVLHMLRAKAGFTDTLNDHCELSRYDHARVSYGPIKTTTTATRPAPSPSPATDHQPESGSEPPV